MKQTYIKPTTEQIEVEINQMVCASPENKYTLNRYSRWGATEIQNAYGNDAWVNEGHVSEQMTIGGIDAVEMAGDDDQDRYSRTNSGLWE